MTDRFNPTGSALITEQNRVRRSRATAGRALTRRRWRRRVLPPLAVTSAVMLGTGTAGAWVHAALQTASPAANSDTTSQLAGLDQLRQQLAADQQTLASLTGVAVPQTAGGTASTVVSSAPRAGNRGSATVRDEPATGAKAATRKARRAARRRPVPVSRRPRRRRANLRPGQRLLRAGHQLARPHPASQPRPTVPAPAPAPTTAAPKPTTPAPAPTTQAPAPTPTVHATTGASGAKP